jgi:hypothetical protein
MDEHLLPDLNWSNFVAVGEAKVKKQAENQVARYLLDHLQLCPERNAVLGFSTRGRGYRLFYHDASVLHASPWFKWTPEPLHSFIRQLYLNTHCDPSMVVLYPERAIPHWVVRIVNEVFVSGYTRPEPAPGQRRFTTLARCLRDNRLWFIKDYWRDVKRRFNEGLLYEKAHDGQHLPGLMAADFHGFVLGTDGKRLSTTTLSPGPKAQDTKVRNKFRIATCDVGLTLEHVTSLLHFLKVMYDTCVGEFAIGLLRL